MTDYTSRMTRQLVGVLGDLRIATRRLAATPLFTVFAVLSLGVGVGVTTAVYSSVDAALWKNTVIPDESTLAVVVGMETGQYNPQRTMSVPDLQDVRASQQAFEAVSAAESIVPSLVTPEITVLTSADAVDASYFSTLGVPAALGRVIGAHDVDAEAQVVVLGYWLWRGRFNADPAVIGRTVRMGGSPSRSSALRQRDSRESCLAHGARSCGSRSPWPTAFNSKPDRPAPTEIVGD